jgi:hypothetical protein
MRVTATPAPLAYRSSMRARHSTIVSALGVLALTAAITWLVRRLGSPRGKVSPRHAMTQALVPVQPADLPLGPPGENLERRLDEALEETYPGSDPISVHIE